MKFKYLFFSFITLFTFTGASFLFQNSSADANAQSISENTKIIVYYFHGNMRCKSCKTIENYTKEAVKTKYQDEIKKGLVEIRTVNVEKSGNSHFIKDYQLVSRSVVVSKFEMGEEKEWKRLDKVWSLLKNESKFFEYIQTNIESLLKGNS
ncbi:MAG: nitrophenyl compound nitroreductase subunit ArsF family protein [Desulfobacteraceae bacterium]|jgi:Fe-S cluster biogenesis protein NfuA